MKTADNSSAYAPDYPSTEWSDRDRRFLEPFFTNVDGPVHLVRNLPPEIVGALCSRASRASASLLRVFLEEYAYPILEGDDRELALELNRLVIFLTRHGFKEVLNNQRAQRLFVKWLGAYGDDSIGQTTGTHLVFDGISQIAIKMIEDRRIGIEPIEQSTRFVNMAEKRGGRYRYYVPHPDLARMGFVGEYCAAMDVLFGTYAALVPRFIEWLRTKYDEKASVLEKKAFDTLRGLLPVSTLGQVAIRGNGQALEYVINHCAQHALGEVRWLARAMQAELDTEIPSLLTRVEGEKAHEYQQQLAKRVAAVRDLVLAGNHKWFVKRGKPGTYGASQVKLVEWDQDGETKIIAGALFSALDLSWTSAMELARELNSEEKRNILEAYLFGRKERWQKVGRAFENAFARFEIVMPIGAYRDLQRHRPLTQERQLFTMEHGYFVPEEVVEAGLKAEYRAAVDHAQALFEKMARSGTYEDLLLAQYAVPMTSFVRFYQYENVRAFIWETELRTTAQGHPDYRWVEQEKFRLLKQVYPLLGEHMFVDMNDYPLARRGMEERMEAREERVLANITEKAGSGAPGS